LLYGDITCEVHVMASPQRELCGLHLLLSTHARRFAIFEMSA
jgi:hypothetical protein